MKPILVTCVYLGQSDWVMGGKDNDEGLYVGSLKNLSKLGMPMHLYCWPHMVDFIDDYLKPFFKDYKVIGCNLFEWPRSYEILETKNKFIWYKREDGNGGFKDTIYAPRNELLCHWKLKWCQMARDNEWGCDKVFWMDAGITEWCKIPLCYGGAEYVYPNELNEQYPDTHFWPENKNNIFNPSFTEGLKKIMSDKEWFFITQNQPNDRLSEFDWDDYGNKVSKIFLELLDWKVGNTYPGELHPDKKAFNCKNCIGAEKTGWVGYPNWTVGTFFGGSFDALDNKIFPMYMKLLDRFTDDHDIAPFTEEPYYSIIAQLYDYNLLWFDNWNHGMADQPVYHGDSKKPFFTTIQDVINYNS